MGLVLSANVPDILTPNPSVPHLTLFSMADMGTANFANIYLFSGTVVYSEDYRKPSSPQRCSTVSGHVVTTNGQEKRPPPEKEQDPRDEVLGHVTAHN